MDKYKETFETWNKVAALYQEKFMHLDIYNESYDAFCDLLPANASVLEIGCGPGNITQYLLSKRNDLKITGIDIAPNMIKLAKKNNPSAEFHVMDSRNIHEFKTTFDGIICGFCLPYLSPEDVSKLIVGCYNLLTVDGVLYLSFVEGDANKSGFMTASTGDRTYFYYHEITTIKKQLNDSNFEEIKTFKVEYSKSETVKEMHTIMIANKEVGK